MRLLAAVLGVLLALVAAPARAGPLVVSLTFDDGLKSHALAGDILAARGLRGTFYINSGPLGSSGFYMTAAEVRRLQALGHEIGGHTLEHKDLTTISGAELRRQICDDRANLLAMGYAPISFAYPYGHHNSESETMARACGYLSARGDTSVPPPETAPPGKPYALRTPPAIASGQTAADMERIVADGERAGGWLIFVFHEICDRCQPLSTTAQDLAAFADYLRSRQGSGVLVGTVGEAIGGGVAALAQDAVRVFPNPWRADRHGGLGVIIDRLSAQSTVRVFTASGRLMRTLEAPAGLARWDLADDAGNPAACGFYLVSVTDPGGKRRVATLAVVR